jgi:hypothetical protein
MKNSTTLWCNRIGVLVILLMSLAGTSLAATGDVHRVTSAKVNLRAGPSNEANVRTTVEEGDELIELRQSGSWLGVRVLRTGEEGWIYNQLVVPVSQSLLRQEARTGPFAELSSGFDSLVDKLNEQLGYDLVQKVERAEDNTLRVTPSQEWLLYGSRDAHTMAALAFYQLWKNHQNDRPVILLVMSNENKPYITITDTDTGPQLSIQTLQQP